VELVSGRSVAGLDDVVIVPVTIDAHVVGCVGQQVQRRTRRALLLVFVFPSGLGACALTRLDLAETPPFTHHSREQACFVDVVAVSGNDNTGDASRPKVIIPPRIGGDHDTDLRKRTEKDRKSRSSPPRIARAEGDATPRPAQLPATH
jgi:hypothetical protein